MSKRSQLSPLDGVESPLIKAPAFSTGHGMASAEVACCAAAGAPLRVCRAGEVALVVAGIDDGGGFVTGGGASRCLSCP
jgi:hypothetical protein